MGWLACVLRTLQHFLFRPERVKNPKDDCQVLNIFRMSGGGGGKKAVYQFFPCNFYKRRNYPKNFWLLVLTLLPYLCKVSKLYLSASPKLLDLNQEHPSKKLVFLIKSLYNCSYNNFSHRNARFTKTLVSWPHLQYNLNHAIQFSLWHYNRAYDAITYVSKYLHFKKA